MAALVYTQNQLAVANTHHNSTSFDESGLIDELLLALVGIHGDLFLDLNDRPEDEKDEENWQLPGPSECSVQISPELTWIGESDREVLVDLLRLGFHFKVVSTFVEWEHAPWDLRHTTRPPSVYRRALASGLTELLDDYRCTVLELQGELRGEAAPALATVRHRMWEYVDVLPALHSLAAAQDRVSLGPTFSAADLINALAAGTRSGLPAVREVMGRLLWHCNQVLMQQLAAWMMHGMLQDPNREFFIQPRGGAGGAPITSAAHPHPHPLLPHQMSAQMQHMPSQHQQQHEDGPPGAIAGGGPGAPGDAAGGPGSLGSGVGVGGVGGGEALFPSAASAHVHAGSGSSGLGGSGRLTDDEAAYREWHGGFQVVPRLLPLYVSHDLAETVLFVGRAVRVLRRPGGAAAGGPGGGGGGPGGAGGCGSGGAAELMPLQDMLQFGQAFTSLQSEPELSGPRLEQLVEGLRAHVARLLWRLLVGRAGLLPHLAALKDYLLLARGDLWQIFLQESRGLMAAPPRPQCVDSDLAGAFSRSAAKSSAEGDPLLGAFSLRYLWGAEAEAAFLVSTGKGPAQSHAVPSLDPAWDPLGLEVRLDWPLGLLLGREQLRRYNQLFALLLRLRRMQGQLDDAWKDLRVMDRQMQREGAGAASRPSAATTGASSRPSAAGRGPLAVAPPPPLLARMRDLQDLRNNMAHLVANLQIYIQTDVIEVNFSTLENKIATCQDFSELERAHNIFLNTLMVQSFLTVRSLCAILTDIFQDVAQLSQLVSRAGCEPQRLDFAALASVRGSFMRHASTLYNTISSQRMIDSFRNPHLAQLVTRLNYNNWYNLATGRGQD